MHKNVYLGYISGLDYYSTKPKYNVSGFARNNIICLNVWNMSVVQGKETLTINNCE